VEVDRRTTVLRFGNVAIDLSARQVSVSGQPVELSRHAYDLLALLANNAGQAISRDQIIEQVYGLDADVASDRVDVLVHRLRSKLGDGPGRGGQIVAVYGFGYRIERRQ
jgi:two-component system response regulator ParR